MSVGRAFQAGLSSLRDRAAARLAALRFNPSREDGLGDELRGALAVVVRRASEGGEGPWVLTLYGCTIRDEQVGDWEISAKRIG